MDRHGKPDVARSDEGWSDVPFFVLVSDGRVGEAYCLLCKALAKLRQHLLKHYSPALGGADGADEVVHVSAWKVIQKLGDYREQRGGVLRWAWEIGNNWALDVVRSEKARRARERGVARPERVEESELVRTVREAVATLPEPHRTVLNHDLDEVEGRSLGLATMFGVTVETVYNWRVQAHAMLLPRLEGAAGPGGRATICAVSRVARARRGRTGRDSRRQSTFRRSRAERLPFEFAQETS